MEMLSNLHPQIHGNCKFVHSWTSSRKLWIGSKQKGNHGTSQIKSLENEATKCNGNRCYYIPYSEMLNPFSVGASQICKYNALTNFTCALALIGLVSTQPPFTGR
jgi:hypothetical protein